MSLISGARILSLIRGPVSRCGGALCGLRAMVVFLVLLSMVAHSNSAAHVIQAGSFLQKRNNALVFAASAEMALQSDRILPYRAAMN